MIFLSLNAFSQKSFEVRLVQDIIECDINHLHFNLQIKKASGSDNFFVADQNYRFNVDPTAIDLNTLLFNPSGEISPTNGFNHQPPLISNNVVSYSINFDAAASSYEIADQWVTVAEIEAEFFDNFANTFIEFIEPLTVMTALANPTVNNSTEAVMGSNFFDYTVNLSSCNETGYVSRFQNPVVDCDANQFFIDIEVKASSGQNFNLGEQSYVMDIPVNTALDYSTVQLAQPYLTGAVNSGTTLSWMHEVFPSISGNLLFYTIEIDGMNNVNVPAEVTGLPVNDSEWISVGQLAFDIVDYEELATINWCLGTENSINQIVNAGQQ